MNDDDKRLIEDYLPIEAISAEASRGWERDGAGRGVRCKNDADDSVLALV